MILLLACAQHPKDPVAGDDTSPEDSAPPADTADTGTVHDTAPVDTGPAPGACASTCDCGEGELCYDGTCAVAGPAFATYRATLDRMVAAMDPGTGAFAEASAYPTEALTTLASGGALLCDDTYADAARTRATFARSWETDDHFLVWSGLAYISRDVQARHIYNLWAAGHALGDPALLAAADDAAEALLALERVPHGDFTLLCTLYDVDAPHACYHGYTSIDVNQDSELGLAYALLADDPESALYQDPLALDVVANELGAAISMQDATTGAIPIGDDPGYEDDYDTLYGSYAAWSWALTDAHLDDPDLSAAVAAASAWLAPYSDADPESHRTYPAAYDGDISLAEGAMRIPLLSRTGVLDPAFVDYFWQTTVAADTETFSVFLPFWLAIDAGVPVTDLLPAE